MTIFSRIINGEIPCYKIAENDRFFAFLDIFPFQYGHTLVIPKVEIDKIFDLPVEYLSGILVFAQPIAKAIEKAFPCNRVNIITVGLEVPHAHIHLVPTTHTADMNPGKGKMKMSAEQLQEVQRKILTALAEEGAAPAQ